MGGPGFPPVLPLVLVVDLPGNLRFGLLGCDLPDVDVLVLVVEGVEDVDRAGQMLVFVDVVVDVDGVPVECAGEAIVVDVLLEDDVGYGSSRATAAASPTSRS